MKYETKKLISRIIALNGIAVLFFIAILSGVCVYAEDWPTYMHDNVRSGVTAESLDLEKLRAGWTYRSAIPPQVAWDGGAPWDSYINVTQVPMRDFDFVFFVTVVGDSMYFGSSVTNSIHCLDTRTGSQKWFFHTDGPVRYPPSIHEGKAYFGSDDGYAYCIDVVDGTLVWKYKPSDDERLIGNNNNLIPMWPIRTGTAVYEGKMYFAASLVNWQRSYLCSLDAKTGTDSGAGLYSVSGGATPMGPIVVSPTKIYLPQGRRHPYSFYRSNGSSAGQLGATGDGGCYAFVSSDSFFVHGTGQSKESGHELREHGDVYISHSNARKLVVANSTGYLLTDTSLAAIDRTDPADPSVKWSVPCDCSYSLILAGEVLFAGGTNKVAAFSTIDGSQLWSETVNGRVRGLAVSNRRLYASTDAGYIHMFGSEYHQCDFNEDGVVDIQDLIIFGEDYLKTTDPTNPNGLNLNR